MVLQRLDALARQHERPDAVRAILRNGDVIETPKRGGDLVLQADPFLQNAVLDVDRGTGERILRDVASVERMHSVDEADSEGRARPKPRSCGKVAVVMDLQTRADVHP